MSINFDQMNLAEVNPDVQPLPDGEYTFMVTGAEKKLFTYKTDNPERGITAGAESSYIKLVLTVIDDAENAGRRVYQTLFPSPQSARGLRNLQDAVGILQESGEPIEDWLKRLVENRVTFKAPLFQKTKNGSDTPEAVVRFTSASAA